MSKVTNNIIIHTHIALVQDIDFYTQATLAWKTILKDKVCLDVAMWRDRKPKKLIAYTFKRYELGVLIAYMRQVVDGKIPIAKFSFTLKDGEFVYKPTLQFGCDKNGLWYIGVVHEGTKVKFPFKSSRTDFKPMENNDDLSMRKASELSMLGYMDCLEDLRKELLKT